MATTTDPLNPPQAPNRVYYALGRMLGAEDFQADQGYHRGRLARALLQVCGTGTVAGLKVRIPANWEANASYGAWAFVVDPNQNVEVNTSLGGTSGNAVPAWPAAPGGQVSDGGITWTNEGPIQVNGWTPNTQFNYPKVIADPNGNLQLLNSTGGLMSGATMPLWNQFVGGSTADGGNAMAWTCLGPEQTEVQVTPGMAIDRVGRMIEVPRPVCIRLEAWLENQAAPDLNNAVHGTSLVVDVFATFVECTRGVTPCFATQDDYDATDAFSPNRLLDSFAMQLVLRSDATPLLPQDPWLAVGALPTPANSPTAPQAVQSFILNVSSGPTSTQPFGAGAIPAEYPPGFDASSVFLARLQISATAGAAGAPPTWDLSKVTIDNFSRLFLYPASLAARWSGLSSGAQK
jgi:hypothetical protein